MTKKVTIPTTSLDNVNRRREQLRQGQRAHRERKNKRVKDLEARVKELEATVLDLENELRSARTLESTPHGLGGIATNENARTQLSTYISPLDFAIETSCSEHHSLCSLGEGDVSISSNDVSMPLAETTDAQDVLKLPATLTTEPLALHQRLEYRTVQRTLEYILTYDFPSLNRLFMFHVNDPSMRHSYMHPEAGEVNRLLGTVFLRGYFAFEWPPVTIPLAEEALTKQGNYMDARQVESYLTTFRDAFPLCLSLRADDFIARLSRLAEGELAFMSTISINHGNRLCHLNDLHRPSLFAFGLASKICHDATIPSIFHDVRVDVGSRGALQRDVDTLIKTVARTESTCHVRIKGHLKLPAKPKIKGYKSNTLDRYSWFETAGVDEILTYWILGVLYPGSLG
ncbi:hypothetical protein V496_02169 [Pseudogymnoascus sp. VKM F-4515 (FW-2607)]|nr:hypothetical protein V496_02169 [Pseudogymnoascus sp. VKM F-4515 (FW-2607)]